MENKNNIKSNVENNEFDEEISKIIKKLNNDNKENVNPRKIIVKKKNIESDESKMSDYYKLLKKKQIRVEAKEEIGNNRFKFKFIENIKNDYIENIDNSKYSFTIDRQSTFNFHRRHYLIVKNQKRIILNIIKSNVHISMINRNYIITERGLDCSQKNHSNDVITVGRQQVNDQGIRPNDIMLFPTDPSVSRCHFKIYYKDFFNSNSEYEKKLNVILCSRKNLYLIYNILKYIKHRSAVAIEDNGTIYGTYVRIKGFSYENFLNNLIIAIRFKISSNTYLDNYTPVQTYQNFTEFGFKLDNELKYNKISGFNNLSNVLNPKILQEMFEDNSSHTICNKNKIQNIRNFSGVNYYIDDFREMFVNNNFLVNNHLPAVFLNNPRLGFTILEIGSFNTIVNAIKNEYYEFNSESNQTLEIVALEKIFPMQKLDNVSQVYKTSMSKEDFISYYFTADLENYSILYLIETAGDPCGVMNRVNDVLFFACKNSNFQIENKKCFTFNYIKGYLIGCNPKSCYNMNTETDPFIYYSINFDKWAVTDLCKFLNPNIYYSENYHGLWICTSPDKKSSNRYIPKPFYIQSGDEIKVSETVFKVNFENLN